jgi:diguanylate cyclase (GGDEF)-like protein
VLTATPDVWLLVSFAIGLSLIAWRVREGAQRRRHLELRLAVRHRTEQLEREQMLDASRNRIMEMLVSNEPLAAVLDAIAKSVREQVPGAHCVVVEKRSRSSDHFVAAAPGLPAAWLAAMSGPGSIPFEVWRQRCEYFAPCDEPAWQTFIRQVEESGETGIAPITIRSVPIGDHGSSSGAILLLYPETIGVEPWERVLGVAERLARIAMEHRRYCDELAFQAHHDSLTGLANRALLDDSLENAVQEARESRQRLAVLYVDIDDFKQINDRYRHRVGDALLVEIAQRIRGCSRPEDTVARIGGDEFNVLLPDIAHTAAALQYAGRLLETVKEPISIEGHVLTVTLSIGIAMYPDDGRSAAELQRQADAAMYHAKSLGKNRVQCFADSAVSLDSVRMEQELGRALQEGWFTVHYQPKFTAENYLAGMEALVRMNHPREGQILPGRFIAIAESSGLIVPIGAWVIGEVCRQMAVWRSRELMPVVVAVNVSAVQIARPDFAMSVEACLKANDVPAHCLELEVTESLLVNADSEEHRQMQLLRKLGVCISIDDFGTGFSSLSYLHRLKVDAVKLDRSFVQTIDSDRGARHLVRAVIDVAQGLGLDVIAEGVETEAQRTELVAVGCPVMQGYLFAHPGPPETIEALLRPELIKPKRQGGDLDRLYFAIDRTSRESAASDVETRVSV